MSNGMECGTKLNVAIQAMGFDPAEFVVTRATSTHVYATRYSCGHSCVDVQAVGPGGKEVSISFQQRS